MLFLTPRYLKNARLLHKGVTRFLNYKRDVLPQAKVNEITAMRTELESAIKHRDEKRVDELTDQINSTCQKALPDGGQSSFAENIEVIFVALVVALGIRAYIVQPFQIPTGSMQPTLNGITAVATAENPDPGWIGTIAGWLSATTYLNVVADRDGVLRDVDPITEHKFLILRPYSKLHFRDGHSIRINCPKTQLLRELQLPAHVNGQVVQTGRDTPDRTYIVDLRGGQPVRKGQLLVRGIVRSGDHVLVNKIAYNFRRPERGEVFVFTTKNIVSPYMNVPAEHGSQHYIKRLVGVPGDTLEVRSPELWVNGKPAEEFGIKRVALRQEPYRGYENTLYLAEGRTKELDSEQYWAMGDNSYNSSDSRYWGIVPERNVVGPGLFCYLPFTSHWGLIK